jgi:dTDP-4-dehydrorhamnose reductase
MTALIVGASGQVGGLLLARWRARGGKAVGTAFRHGRPGLRSLDVRDAGAVAGLVAEVRPEVVFLPGAMTHVDYAEEHPEECRAVNVAGTAHLARAVRGTGAVLVHFSTEHVFPDGPDPYPEEASCAPRSVYAQSKAEAESVLRDLLPDRHLILRTSWVYGPEEQGKNFVYRAVATLRRGERLVVPADQYGQPTYSPDLADAALDLVAAGRRGTFHAVGPAFLTRLAFAERIAAAFGLDAGLIRGVPTATLGQAAPRPLNIRLRRGKLQAALGRDPIRGPDAALAALRKDSAGLLGSAA